VRRSSQPTKNGPCRISERRQRVPLSAPSGGAHHRFGSPTQRILIARAPLARPLSSRFAVAVRPRSRACSRPSFPGGIDINAYTPAILWGTVATDKIYSSWLAARHHQRGGRAKRRTFIAGLGMTDIFSRGFRPKGPVATRHIYERMRSLQVGEAFTVKWNDWGTSSPPNETIRRSPRYREYFKVEGLDGGKGWRITRIR
jgi:hypothetical protein